MTTQGTTQLQNLMQDLQQRQKDLGEQLQAYQALQNDIAQLQHRAPHDAQARARLDRLSRAMQGEFGSLNQRLQHCADSLQPKLEALEVALRATGSTTPAVSSATAGKRKGPLPGRAFF